jgi:multidrug efflux pump subunit AcrB
MWIVKIALSRPHTFVVLAITIALFGMLSLVRMAVDIFPVINIPIVSCAWTYTGMSPYYMENMVTTVTERSLTSTLNNIQRMESISLSGLSIVKVYLQQGTDVGEDVAMVTAVGTAILRQLPRGIAPPFVTSSSATDVPVLQLVLQSDSLGEAELFDLANNLVRTQLATVQGATVLLPYGGKYRQVMIDLYPNALYAYGLSADAVVTAVKNQSVIAPCGTAKMGAYEYSIVLNNVPLTIAELNKIPIKSTGSAVVFLKDVANVHDGYQPQLNIVNINGRRSVLMNILKSGDASTLAVVNRVKQALPHIRELVPPACKISILTDQSIFVQQCVEEVAREAMTAAGLTALMMLAFLGSWQSTLIVATSIPLAMLCSIIGLNICGQTINSMTLGGLALAVGMLVDDATVAIENIHRNLDMGKVLEQAILDGSEQVALPALVSTMSICIVFVPVFLLTEPSKSLFVPLGMAVIFAMMASYGLSRTLVPLMIKMFLAREEKTDQANEKTPSVFSKIHAFIESNFEALRTSYSRILALVLNNPKRSLAGFLAFYALSFCLLPFIGEDYFPSIDAGQLRLHVNAAPGTRVEETERIFKTVEAGVRKTIPANELDSITDNIGLPISALNYALSDSQTVSEADGEILISLTEKRKHETSYYQKEIRKLLSKEFPTLTCYFQPADIVTQILNAGLPAPIDIKVAGFDRKENYERAQKIKRAISKVSGIADVTLHQVVKAPHISWTVDRVKADQMGVTQEEISNSFLISLSSSFQTEPNFWLNPKNRINYNFAAQVPQYALSNLDDLRVLSVTPTHRDPKKSPQLPLLTNLAKATREPTEAVSNHINVAPVYDIYAACQGRDLGGVATDVGKILKEIKKDLPKSAHVIMFGQVLNMYLAFAALLLGLGFSTLLVYLLLVVNFQSWKDPLIILMAIPGALSGILWSLYVTQTTFSIPALMGTIMTIGVASANSILMVSFARDQYQEGMNARESALTAGIERFRPVIMTATAMIIGMIPMAIGGGEGGSQNAPIGRAVIGGLVVATLSTLLLVPLIFSMTRKDHNQG